ncbi:hypothetical protein IFM89_002804 [Coptis chinensis]|uniref:Pentatricopeptide repeat-containing protein n=1 Tax=Coptis chinensis TaxID=261450 RepID=A0A835HT14_9MAGN|nr:hypothetical protein IFM89_002804 [Coptis chinensis]
MGKDEKALGLFHKNEREALHPNRVHIHRVDKGLGTAGRIEEAYGMFLKMREDGCRPDVVLMNNIINAFGRAVVWGCYEGSKDPGVASWLEKMKENGITPSDFTYSILIDGFCKTNRVEKALFLLEEMDEKGFPPCPSAYCLLLMLLGKQNDTAAK